MAITRDEFLTAAVQLERDGYDFYVQAAGNATSDLSRETFESLAQDELRHIKWIQSHTPTDLSVEDANKAIYARLRPVFADLAESERETAGRAATDVEALNFAIEREEKARRAYAEWAEEVEEAEIHELCEKLVQLETFHRQLLENVLQYLEHPHDFFLREERWIVEG